MRIFLALCALGLLLLPLAAADPTFDDPGTGNVRPCHATEPNPAFGLLQWVAWTGVHDAESASGVPACATIASLDG